MKTIVVCSGGLDSVTLAHKVAAEQQLIGLVSFDYGQRHRKELDFAARCASRLAVPHHIIDIASIGGHLSGSALTDNVEVPDGHYAEETMKATVVPNRNAIMLAIAFGLAAAQNADAVAVAVHGGDHFIYPDCRPGFIDAFQHMQNEALDGYARVKLLAPYVDVSKAAIVVDGEKHGTPFSETWSCYKGGELHCGRCGTCVERREAFHLAGVRDPTEYEDQDFWKAAVSRYSAAEVR
ncbi:7-cyano-7-deazaguanine synthase QueC [Rhizobium brockwellii]|jgi:7-cyano-7-deazaguanine synthase|uniref:7-cyano-7-deazaguanine synthase n=2 Tax=Rhizobium TaxID=379 RepID=A0ABU3YXH4_9HYPH|nr:MULTISPECIES: 7-cyano-7-deazaguanine synthase QueC [Rhizobium]KPN27439.1 7-cyano-7-deazaguanine synthase [Rhizobium brockwellii]MDV4159283.1 7-cyano-7-deazaguanine synthase QueC [Rhizobium brockwellii]MDV4183567.1 7-cyano-7-deazaguanine synthase QueC [Rhizobium brockwellii]MDV4190546.1 7-cyano-7-deazaguanine synthase QueC [Rhizobium brockwellii]NZD54770.1 7-cyano-7-deazaguanine synthase QueC [Rhizobium leguminosarum]